MSLPNLVVYTDLETYPFIVPTDSDFGNDRIADIVTTFQPIVLQKILGLSEYWKFYASWNGTSYTDQRWTDFVNGKTFTVSSPSGVSLSLVYPGIKDALKYFIYYYYVRFGISNVTQTGIVKPANENSVPANIFLQSVSAWNEGVDKVGTDWNAKFYGYSGYPVKQARYFHTPKIKRYIDQDEEKLKPTVYNFLYYYQQLGAYFTDWEFTEFEKINIHGF